MTQTGYLNQPYAGPFTPADERQVADVLSCLADPEHSLASVADRHATTIHALTQWMVRPDIAARLDAIEGAFARMVRLQVADSLPHAATCLVDVIRDTQDELEHIPKNPSSVRHLEQRTRCRDTARKACALLIRLARFTGGPAPERKPRELPSTTPTRDPLPEPRAGFTAEDLKAALDHFAPVLNRRQAGDEAPPQPPPASPPPSTPTPEGRCEAHPRVSPSPAPPPLDNTPRATPHKSSPSYQSHPSHLINRAGAVPTPQHKAPEVVLTISAKSQPTPNSKGRCRPSSSPRRDPPPETQSRVGASRANPPRNPHRGRAPPPTSSP